MLLIKDLANGMYDNEYLISYGDSSHGASTTIMIVNTGDGDALTIVERASE